MSSPRILVIEDNKPLLRALRQGLNEAGFSVDTAADGAEGDTKVRSARHDLVVLDLMLPKIDGMTLLKNWRRDDISARVLVVTARSGIQEKVSGLNAGADDYLAKPFNLEELLARIRALLRRGREHIDQVVRVYDLEIDTHARRVKRCGKDIHLTRREYALLHLLAAHRGNVVTRQMIWQCIYDEPGDNMSNVVDVYIRYLRTKIDTGFDPPLILTRWGEGYLLRDE